VDYIKIKNLIVKRHCQNTSHRLGENVWKSDKRLDFRISKDPLHSIVRKHIAQVCTKMSKVGPLWLVPVILATQDAA
jgi:hypothetical protein